MSRPLLVSAGEASGDALAAATLRALRAEGWPGLATGLGGPSLRQAGADLAADMAAITASGVGDVLRVLPRAAATLGRMAWTARVHRPGAALLVDFTSFHARLGRWLKGQGVPVLWAVAPQLWAWRPDRGPSLARSMTRLGVLFAFEVEPWRRLGVEAHWVGHPSVDALPARTPDEAARAGAAARAALGLPASGAAVALLPGSRPGEVRRLLEPMLAAAGELAAGDGVRSSVLLAPSLPGPLRAWAAGRAEAAGVEVIAVRAGQGTAALLPAFDAALCASGTATLECALAGVRPVITYRVDALTALAARRWLRTEHVGLPNVVLGRRAFAERLQEEATGAALAAGARAALRAGACRSESAELRERLDPGDGLTAGERLGARLGDWLGQGSRAWPLTSC